MGGTHAPPAQNPLQQSPFAVQLEPSCVHGFTGGAHAPAWQLPEQQSQSVVHVADCAAHGSTHDFVFGSQMPRQQSPSCAHVAPSAWHAPDPHRGSLSVLSQMPEQQPCCGPELHVSPVPRHVVFCGSSWHWCVFGSQMFEQHSAFAWQGSLSTPHSGVPHLPFQHPRPQQSIAFVHAAPFARHAAAHTVTFDWPCTGSQRPLQHASFFGSHVAPAARQAPVSTQTSFWHTWEQHVWLWEHVVATVVHELPVAAHTIGPPSGPSFTSPNCEASPVVPASLPFPGSELPHAEATRTPIPASTSTPSERTMYDSGGVRPKGYAGGNLSSGPHH
jgi:hypothetical protein